MVVWKAGSDGKLNKTLFLLKFIIRLVRFQHIYTNIIYYTIISYMEQGKRCFSQYEKDRNIN